MVSGGNITLERRLQARIITRLNYDKDTLVRCRSADSVGHIVGDPDITGVINGRHVEIEVKSGSNKPTKIQRVRLDQWAERGACCCWVNSSGQALAFQQEVLAGRCEGRVLEPCALLE